MFRFMAGIRFIGEAVFSFLTTFFSCLVELVISFLCLFSAARRYESLRRLAGLYDRPPL
jgi:NO-binding membrane sensor protein with MHYT domain